MVNFIVLGAGAIGTFFGQRLSKKYPVVFIGRKDRLKKIKSKTIIILSTKIPDSFEALKKIKKLLKKDTIILVLQNGIGQEEEYKKIVACRLFRAVTDQGAIYVKPGVVKSKGILPTFIEKGGESIAQLFNQAGIPTKISNDMRKKVWEKLIINCVINGLGTILSLRNNELNNPTLSPIKQKIVEEAVNVASYEGIIFNHNVLNDVNSLILKSKNINSTLQDLNRGKKTEIDYINGAVVKLGKKYGIKTYLNQAIYETIKEYETQISHADRL